MNRLCPTISSAVRRLRAPCRCWCRCRRRVPIPIPCPRAWRSSPAPSCRCRSARAWWPASFGIGRSDGVDPKKLRPIEKVFDCPPLTKEMRAFVDWVSAYTLTPPGLVARMALRAPAAFDPEPMVEGLRFTGVRPERMTAARERVLALAEEGLPWTRSGLAHAAGTSSSVIDGLTAQGSFETIFLPPPPVVARPDPDYVAPRLEGPQTDAAADLVEKVRDGHFGVALIDGVTGSGKTEVYFEAIAETLRQGRQVLILLPEIALDRRASSSASRTVSARKPAEWHSDLAPRTREKVWRQVDDGRGARRRRRALGAVPAVRGPWARSSSTRSTTLPTSRRTASSTMPATWRWCAAGSAASRSCWSRRRRRSRAGSMPTRAATRRLHLPTRFGEAAMPDLHLDRPAPSSAAARRLSLAGHAARASARRSSAANRRCSSSTAAAMRR